MLADEIQTRLMTWLSQATNVPEIDLEANRPLAEYGLDSLAVMELIDHLESGLGLKLSPTIAWTYPTPELLARHLSKLITSGSDVVARPEREKPADDGFAQLLAQLEQMPEDQVAAMLAAEGLPETPE